MTGQTSPAAQLVGMTLSGGWQVTKAIPRQASGTGGNFSCGFFCVRNGNGAYVKALDFSEIHQNSKDVVSDLRRQTTLFEFERNVLIKCQSLSKVITILDHGQVTVGQFQVPYLILELAGEGDLRSQANRMKRLNLAWRLRSMHHISVGLRQLHERGIAHQDVKPSNVLTFENEGSKLTDLGRSSQMGVSGPHDHRPIAGDKTYGPPELLYGDTSGDWNCRRFACDAYHLGSMIAFFETGVPIWPQIEGRLKPTFHHLSWSGGYSRVLPYIKAVHDEVVRDFETRVDTEYREDLSEIVRQLCEPDPILRGHPRNRIGVGNPYSLERYVSILDRLALRAEVSIG